MAEKKLITKDTLVIDVLDINPRAKEVFDKYGMHCLTCMFAAEPVETAAAVHGIDLEELLEELNKA